MDIEERAVEIFVLSYDLSDNLGNKKAVRLQYVYFIYRHYVVNCEHKSAETDS